MVFPLISKIYWMTILLQVSLSFINVYPELSMLLGLYQKFAVLQVILIKPEYALLVQAQTIKLLIMCALNV